MLKLRKTQYLFQSNLSGMFYPTVRPACNRSSFRLRKPAPGVWGNLTASVFVKMSHNNANFPRVTKLGSFLLSFPLRAQCGRNRVSIIGWRRCCENAKLPDIIINHCVGRHACFKACCMQHLIKTLKCRQNSTTVSLIHSEVCIFFRVIK